MSVAKARRIIVKIGTSNLSAAGGTTDLAVMSSIVDQIAQLKKQGHEVVLISSGAVGAGRAMFTLPTEGLREKQVYSAIGQARLISLYGEVLRPHNLICAQVLATKLDFQNDDHRTNMQRCLENLLHDNILPIVNENDVVALEELMFTDNDELAGLVAGLLKANIVVILTSVDGVLDENDKLIAEIKVASISDTVASITPEVSSGGQGGMLAKFNVAKELALAGMTVRIVNGRTANILLDAVSGDSVGTLIAARI